MIGLERKRNLQLELCIHDQEIMDTHEQCIFLFILLNHTNKIEIMTLFFCENVFGTRRRKKK